MLILASSSPRRKELLSTYTTSFVVEVPDVSEACGGEPSSVALKNAEKKACAVSASDDDFVIGCDTIVVLDGKIYGKPQNFEMAKTILGKLSGRTHTVISGVCVKKGEKAIRFTDVSFVKLKKLSAEETEYYINFCKPYDKAGGYGIQDEFVVDSYEGDYQNIMGFPLKRVVAALKELNYDEE